MFLIKRELFSISFHSLGFTVEGLNWDWRSWCFCYPLSPTPLHDVCDASLQAYAHQMRDLGLSGQGAPLRPLPVSQGLYPVRGSSSGTITSWGVKVLQFLDDWLGCAPSQAWVVLDASRFLTHVARLGLRSQLPNSCLVSDVDDILHLLLMS